MKLTVLTKTGEGADALLYSLCEKALSKYNKYDTDVVIQVTGSDKYKYEIYLSGIKWDESVLSANLSSLTSTIGNQIEIMEDKGLFK